jgi:hypothetical protein
MNGNIDKFLEVLDDHSQKLQAIQNSMEQLTGRVEKILDNSEHQKLLCSCLNKCTEKDAV